MSIIIQSPRMASGLSGGYLTLRKPQANQILNALEATPALETPASANVANYTIAVAEVGSMGIYSATLTTSQNAALSSGSYAVEGFFGTGTAAVGDKVQWSGSLSIDGSGNESFPLASSAAGATNQGNTTVKDIIPAQTISVAVPAAGQSPALIVEVDLQSEAKKAVVQIDNTAGSAAIVVTVQLRIGPGAAVESGGNPGSFIVPVGKSQLVIDGLIPAYSLLLNAVAQTGNGGTWNIGVSGAAA